ncbi:MAG: family 20 glycosylhydrolase [Clostridia bacterium]|nr:family 20 glycosylhydrolase [Clostridia bacterium]
MINIIPTPKNAELGAMLVLPATVVPCKEGEIFAEYAKGLGVDFKQTENGAVRTVLCDKRGYTLEADEQGVTIKGDREGINQGFATLLQLLEPAEGGFSVQRAKIEDEAQHEYRGLLVDLARSFHELDIVLSYVDMCYYYKIKYLHLHFTDDQGYTLPSRLFPKLSTPERCYSAEQIDLLVRYATERSVRIVPEIDLPGHCASFCRAYPEIFGDHGVICLTEQSVEAIKSLYCELCDMFPQSEHIHIGGDEASITKWLECDRCLSYAEKRGIDTGKQGAEHVILADFISQTASVIRDKGRKPIVWEGFIKDTNHMVRDVTVMSWENYYQTTPELLEAGYDIINCSWEPNYIVTPTKYWPAKEVLEWDPYSFKAAYPGSVFYQWLYKAERTARIKGGQLCAWGDVIVQTYPVERDGVLAERELVSERLPCVAQRTWSGADIAWSEFEESHKKQTERLVRLLRP